MAFKGLPDYIDCGTELCTGRHFLTFNRDTEGRWSAGYVEFEDYTTHVSINNADSLKEASIRLKYAVKRGYEEQDIVDV